MNKPAETSNAYVGGPGVPPPMVEYFVYANGQQSGPYNMAQLAQMAKSGALTKETFVWKNGMQDWMVAGSVVELGKFFTTNTPPPPPMGMK